MEALVLLAFVSFNYQYGVLVSKGILMDLRWVAD
jgi:hypothetical protein